MRQLFCLQIRRKLASVLGGIGCGFGENGRWETAVEKLLYNFRTYAKVHNCRRLSLSQSASTSSACVSKLSLRKS